MAASDDRPPGKPPGASVETSTMIGLGDATNAPPPPPPLGPAH